MPLDEILAARREKLEKLRKAGIDPYPAKSWRTHSVADTLKNFDALVEDRKLLVLAGRVMAIREHGGSTFIDLDDGTAATPIQIFLKKDVLGDREYNLFLDTIDIGDFIEVSGTLFLTKKNERTLRVEKHRVLTKSLRPLPEKWHGLQDVEERYRRRYIDLLLNRDLRKKFEVRTRVIQEIKNFLNFHNFLEVDTPVLQTLAGGTLAKPFRTHMNALDLDLSLRIAPELFLKRLLVAGFERVYELARNFRNEGMDRDHNPEFSMLEFYAAYKDYEWLMEFTEEMLETVVKNIFGGTVIGFEDHKIDFKKPYARVAFNDLFREHTGIDYDIADTDTLVAKAKELKIVIDKTMTKGNIADEIYKKVARPNYVQPTFVVNHPRDISPLSKSLENDPEHVARLQLVVAGREILNAYSELNDPIDQRQRFQEQAEAAGKGNEEAHPFDEDFVEALEYGMPPAAGWGLGIDRFVSLLTDSHSIREIILFPLMKPKK